MTSQLNFFRKKFTKIIEKRRQESSMTLGNSKEDHVLWLHFLQNKKAGGNFEKRKSKEIFSIVGLKY